MDASRPLHVFLCHASADKPVVRKLYHYLQYYGVIPWLDEFDLLPGVDWQNEIPKAIFSSDAIVVCLSKNSISKEGYIQKEIAYALEKALEKPEGTIFIIPCKLEDCTVPSRLSKWQWVNLFEDAGLEALIKSLQARAIQLGLKTNSFFSIDKPNIKFHDLFHPVPLMEIDTVNALKLVEGLRKIIQGVANKIYGVKSIYLIDLSTYQIIVSYPGGDIGDYSEIIRIITPNTGYQVETHVQSINSLYLVDEMILNIRDNKQLYLTRVSSTLYICIVGDKNFQVGFAKLLCKAGGGVDNDIISIFQNFGITLRSSQE